MTFQEITNLKAIIAVQLIEKEWFVALQQPHAIAITKKDTTIGIGFDNTSISVVLGGNEQVFTDSMSLLLFLLPLLMA